MLVTNSMTRLFDMTRMINSDFNMDHILQVLVDAIGDEIAGADLVGYFHKEDGGTFRGYVGNKLPVDIKELVIDPQADQFVRDILQEAHSQYIADTNVDKRPDPSKVALLHIQSIYGIPVRVNSETIGLIFIHDFGKPMNLTSEQMDVIESFVNMASVAIKNVYMFDETQRLLKQQDMLLETTKAMAASLSTQDVLNACFHYVGEALGNGDVAIHIFDESDQTFRPYHIAESSRFSEVEWKNRHRAGIRISLEKDPLFRELVTYEQAISISDVYSDARPNHEACKIFDIRSMLLVPLKAKGRLFGAVAVVSVGQTRTYSRIESDLCQSIADITATALSNTLYAENLDAMVKERTSELLQANLTLENYVKELHHLDEMKGDFLSSLSHELRTPITAIKGAIEIFQRGYLGELSEPQLELMNTADVATRRLLNQVTELLDFSKITNGNFELTKSPEEIDSVVSEAVEIMRPLIDRKGQLLRMKLSVQKPIKVDRQRLLQVVLNLLSNANKFTPDKGEITIVSYADDSTVVVEVADTGIGIPVEKQKYIFTKFYQVDNVVNGTGLGLSIAQNLIELHGGRISFVSTPQTGTTFTVVLPVDDTAGETKN